jgi:ornithine carbamoyltransferase
MRKLKIVPRTEREVPLGPRPASLIRRHLISLHDLTPTEVEYLLRLALQMKAHPHRHQNALAGATLALLIEKPSLCSRVTFEVGMGQLGGRVVYLGPQEVGLDKHEALKDVARQLSRWVEAIMSRGFPHQDVVELAEQASVPVVNSLSDFEHPCQALGDYLTLLEHKGELAGKTLAWVGDGNNVAHSLIHGATRLGIRMRIATPPGYEPDRSVVAEAQQEGGNIVLTHDPAEAVAGADAVYTDVWTSIGQEEEAETRRQVFRPYQVNSQLMRGAGPQALFMHCLPTRRGQEVTDEVIDSPRSIVYDQAENRLHIQKAILLALLG